MLCSAGSNGSHQGEQPVSVWRHYTEYLDRKNPARAVDGLTDITIFILFLALEEIPSLMYTSNKLFPGVIDNIPSDKKTRGHTFSRDLYWLSCGEGWQSLRLLIMTYKKLYALPCVVLTAWEVINGKQFHFAHTFSQDWDWLPSDNNDQVFYLLVWNST